MLSADNAHDAMHPGSISATGSQDKDSSETIAELRRDLAAVAAAFKAVIDVEVGQAANVVADEAQKGVSVARDLIRSNPVAAICLAGLIGAAVGVAVMPAKPRSRLSQLRDWAPNVDLRAMSNDIQRTASNAGPSMLSAFERVVESVSSIDPTATINPAIEKAWAWLTSLGASAGGK